MKLASVILFIAVSTANIHAFNNLIPRNKEVIYSWKADVKAGTYLPDSYASQLVLEAKLHLQADDSSIFVKITNLTQRTYNGVFDFVHELETRELPVPEEAQDFGRVFRILYTEGLVKEISTQKEEKEFSRNIKKAIASTLQLKSTVVGEEHGTFPVQEKSIHGFDQTVYDVFTLDGNKTEIWKLRNSDDSSTVKSPCYATKERNLQQDNLKKYFLEKEDDKFVVKRITTSSSIVHFPFKAKSVAQMILVNQTFDLVEMVPIQEEYKVESEYLEKSLTYHRFNKLKDDLILDVTNGRHVINYEKLIPTVKNLLQDVYKYLHEDHIKTDEADIKRGQLIDRLQKILTHFSYKKLEEFRKMLADDDLQIFYQILPLVGTKASALYIQTLIKEKKVDEATAINLIQHLPETIKPSIDLLTKLEDLLHLNESLTVRKVAILTFGSLVHKSYKHHRETSDEEESKKVFQKYVKRYIDKAKNSDSYLTQMSYLLGLQNMKLPMVTELLVPAIKGEWSSNRHLRFTALKAVDLSSVSRSSSDIVKIFWSIFTNREEFTEMRLLSYSYIMRLNPALLTIKNLHEHALADPDEELYQYHWEFSQALMQTRDPCYQELKSKVSQVMEFSPEPKGYSKVADFGYQDPHYGYGGGIKYDFFNTNSSRIYTAKKYSQWGSIYEEDYELSFKLHDGRYRATNKPLLADLSDFLRYGTHGSLQEFHSKFLGPPGVVNHPQEEFHCELILSRGGQVVDFYFIDRNNSDPRLPSLGSFLQDVSANGSLSTNSLYTHYYPRHRIDLIPTDLGIPAIFERVMPDVHHLKASIDKRIVGGEFTTNFDTKYTNWVHYRSSLSFYNPISDIWHGIDKRQYYDLSIPVHFTLIVNPAKGYEKILWKKHEDPAWNVAGMRSFVEQTTFIKGTSLEEQRVKRIGNQKLIEKQLFDRDFADLGYKISAGLFQSDLYLPKSVIKNSLKRFLKPEGKYFNWIQQLAILSWLNFQDTLILFPRAGTNGFIFKIEPSTQHPVTSLELFSDLYPKRISKSFPEGYIQITVTLRNQQEIVRNWDVKVMAYNKSSDRFPKFEVTRSIPNESNYKICLDGVVVNNEIQAKIVMGQSRDECVNDGSIDLKITEEESLEQKNSKYWTCLNPFNREKTCQFNTGLTRHKTLELKSENVPGGLKSFVVELWDQFRNYYHSYYTHEFLPNDNITADSFKASITYPLNSDSVNIDIETNQEVHQFSTIPYKLWMLENFSRSNVHFDHCIIYPDHYFFNEHLVSKEVPTEWTTFVKSRFSDSISLKLVSNRMAVNVTSFRSLEIEPAEDSFIVRYNGTEIGSEEYFEVGMMFKKITDGDEVLVAYLPQMSIYLEYYVDRVVIAVPQQPWLLTGRCYSR